MQQSARVLGQDYGLNAQEMNRVLKKFGFLEGTPGDYAPTEKAMPYVKTEHFHRGTGGYAHYNRYWSTRTFDDSIKDHLNVTPELIDEVRNEIANERSARYVAQAAAREKANQEFIAKQAADKLKAEAEVLAAKEAEELVEKIISATKICAVAGGVVLIGYGIYKFAPRIKKWWNDNTKEHNNESDAA